MINRFLQLKVILVVSIFSGSAWSMVFDISAANATSANFSNTTSADIPTGVNDPGLPEPTPPELSNTTSADIPTGVNDPGLPEAP